MESALLRATRMFGSCAELALLIGVSPQTLDNWLNKPINVPLPYAMAIEAATKKRVSWKELVTREVKEVLEHANALLTGEASYFIPYEEIAINKITLSTNSMTYSSHENDRPICIDENKTLIYGEETLCFYRENGKKKIPVRRLSLFHLAQGNYQAHYLKNIFTLAELTMIGIRVEKFLGERRGRRNVQNSALIHFEKGIKTRKFLAKYLGFGSHFTYQQAKILLQYGCPELINQVNQKKMAVSKAARLAKLSHEEQLKQLTLTPNTNY